MKLAVGLLAVLAAVNAKAIEATDKTLPELVASGVPMFLDLYASWCGHCKTLSPIVDELADRFEKNADKIQVVKIDADKERQAGRTYGVEYFPTLRFLDGKGNVENYEGGRSLEDLTAFVTSRVKGLRTAKKPKLHVQEITPTDLDTLDQPALLAFTADWCGHCKNLKPVFEQVAGALSKDKVVIGNVDCTSSRPDVKGLCSRFDVSSYPTLLYFEPGAEPVPYTGDRTVKAFLDFVNAHAGTARAADGSLTAQAGLIPELQSAVADYVLHGSTKALVEAVATATGPTAEVYRRIVAKLAEDSSYVARESKRVASLIAKRTVAEAQLDQLQIKLNILQTLQADTKDEL